MTLYLLDSDATIDELKRIPSTGELLRRLTADGHRLCTCTVVVAEVFGGVYPKDEERAKRLLDGLPYLPTSQAAAEQAGRWRYGYARIGRPLSATDLLIAATAVSNAATLITGNTRDFPLPEISILPLPR